MAKIFIDTTQNVKIEYRLAGLGDRILAYLFDLLLQIIYLFLIFFGVVSQMPSLFGGATSLIIFLPIIFYHFFFETILNGQSPGKKIRNTRVIKTDGSPAGIAEYFSRWIASLFEFSVLAIFAVISISVSKKSQRLGDMLAGTTVVKLDNKTSLKDYLLTKIDDDYQPVYAQAEWLKDEEVDLLNKILQKAQNNSQSEEVIDAMYVARNKICRKYKINTSEGPFGFFSQLIKDYNYYKGVV